LSDGATKLFTIKGRDESNRERLEWFMDSITDELAEGYFPKERTKNGKRN